MTTTPDAPARRRRRSLLGPAVAGLLALALPAAGAGASAAAVPTAGARPTVAPLVTDDAHPTTATSTWVVQVAAGHLDSAARAVRAAGGRVVQRLAHLDVLVVRAGQAQARRIAAARGAGVTGVTADSSTHLLSSGWGGSTYSSTSTGSSSSSSSVGLGGSGSVFWGSGSSGGTGGTGWDEGWSSGSGAAGTPLRSVERDLGTSMLSVAGINGSGVDVAVLDSGVSRVPGLDAAGKVVYGPDLTTDALDPVRRNNDGFGHGTHVAGIIAGADPDTTAEGVRFTGIAPRARVVSVKVATANGATSVSTMLVGLEWVIANRTRGVNLRVLNLAFGTDSSNAALLDPIAAAVERVWASGIVVVVSAGNQGDSLGHLLDPAYDPYVIAVGAQDLGRAGDRSDDQVTSFSSRGDGRRNPDLVAPGVDLESLRVPGSTVDLLVGPGTSSGPRFLRGSGTSQAAAVVSGAVALLLQARPTLTNDQVKDVLRSSADELRGATPEAQGRGAIDLLGALGATPTGVRQSWPRASGLGSTDAASGSYLGKSWAGKAWAGKAWASIWL